MPGGHTKSSRKSVAVNFYRPSEPSQTLWAAADLVSIKVDDARLTRTRRTRIASSMLVAGGMRGELIYSNRGAIMFLSSQHLPPTPAEYQDA